MALVNMSDQFQGLPMDNLIGGPLIAAVNAQMMLARSTATFINTVGFDQLKDGVGKLRTVEFAWQAPVDPPEAFHRIISLLTVRAIQ